MLVRCRKYIFLTVVRHTLGVSPQENIFSWGCYINFLDAIENLTLCLFPWWLNLNPQENHFWWSTPKVIAISLALYL